MASPATMSREAAEDFLIHEAELLDELRLDEWLRLFTSDGVYWIPLDADAAATEMASIVRDDTLRREERVFHLLHTRFPSQSPRSRTLHQITNVRVRGDGDSGLTVVSNQVIHEMRTGDYRQTGLGQPTQLVARVEHCLRLVDGSPRIALKTILLINRDMPLGNLTFLF